ncbi:MAG: hypothetical protein ACM3PP_05095 [Candidatus Saccharibacteria bacterium]
MNKKIYIYKTIEAWNEQETEFEVEAQLERIENGIAVIRDTDGNRQYINLDHVFCLVEAYE